MATITINDTPTSAPEGATLLAAIRALGFDVPTLCHRDDLEHATSCMLCVVEDLATGRLLPACSTPVRDGLHIATASPAVLAARREALELLLGDHLGDCEGPCRLACPAGLDIPAMLHALAAGDPTTAARLTRRDLVLPVTLGRICPAPCEKACRRRGLDAAVAIRTIHRVAGASSGALSPSAPTGFHVAVVGGGPAGLAAAASLRAAGHACTLFEREAQLGGGLRAPELRSRLPSDALESDIAWVLERGVTVNRGVEVGRDVSLASLIADFDAVVLACGPVDTAAARRLGLDATARGLACERLTHRTALPTVFACGAAVFPGRIAARAVGEGRTAAAAVWQMLRGEPVEGEPSRYRHRIGAPIDPAELSAMLAAGASAEPRVVDDNLATDCTPEDARREAARCLHCECRKADVCKLRIMAETHGLGPGGWKPAERRHLTIQRQGGTVYEPGKCIACGICVRLTKLHQAPLGLAFIGCGFNVRVGVPFDEPLDAALRSLAADCVAACPTGALAFAGDEAGTSMQASR